MVALSELVSSNAASRPSATGDSTFEMVGSMRFALSCFFGGSGGGFGLSAFTGSVLTGFGFSAFGFSGCGGLQPAAVSVPA